MWADFLDCLYEIIKYNLYTGAMWEEYEEEEEDGSNPQEPI